MTELTKKQREALRSLGELFDEIDAETRLPGEASLRSVVGQHAREQLPQEGSPS